MRYTGVPELEADGGYVATVPALPGCLSYGDTREEVTRNIREAADPYARVVVPAQTNPSRQILTESDLKPDERVVGAPLI
jgi:predicted RNase H-like HicB family nuclease